MLVAVGLLLVGARRAEHRVYDTRNAAANSACIALPAARIHGPDSMFMCRPTRSEFSLRIRFR